MQLRRAALRNGGSILPTFEPSGHIDAESPMTDTKAELNRS